MSGKFEGLLCVKLPHRAPVRHKTSNVRQLQNAYVMRPVSVKCRGTNVAL